MAKYKVTFTPTEAGSSIGVQSTIVKATNNDHARYEAMKDLYGNGAFWWSDADNVMTGHVYRDQGGTAKKVSPHVKLEITKLEISKVTQ